VEVAEELAWRLLLWSKLCPPYCVRTAVVEFALLTVLDEFFEQLVRTELSAGH
jgi:hypothetical protein